MPLAKQSRQTFLVAALVLAAALAAGAQSPLLTTFVGGNGQAGNMFDVKSLTGVLIQDFDCNFAGSGDFEVWALNTPGTYLGNEGSNANWTMLASVTGVVGTTGVPTPLGLSLNFAIPPGITQAFYIHRTNGTITYTNGSTQGTLFSSNTDLEFYEGHGGTYFSLTFVPRVWNGQIHYLPLSTVADDISLWNIVAPIDDTIDCSPRSATEPVTIDLFNFGMNPIAAGTALFVSFQVDSGTPVTETITTAAPLNPGQMLQYTFMATADLSAIGPHTVTTSVIYGLDLDPSNDSQTVNVGSGGQLRVSTFPYSEDFATTVVGGDTSMPVGFVQDPGDGTGDFSDWVRTNLASPTSGTGPTADNTTGTSGQGGYIFAEDNGNFQMVNLRSPCFDMGGLITPSMRFFLHSFNSVSGGIDNSFSIDIITYPGNTTTMDVFGPVGSGTNGWEMQAVDLSAFSGQLIQAVLRADTSVGGGASHDIAIDDFSIVELAPTPGQAPQPGLAVLDLNAPRNINGDIIAFGFGGPYFAEAQIGGSLVFGLEGEPLQPAILFAGPLNAAIASFPGIGSMDCGASIDPVSGLPTGLTVLADGTLPLAGPFNPFFVTSATGRMDIGFSVPNLPVGVLSTFQCAFITSGGAGVALSNAVELSIIP